MITDPVSSRPVLAAVAAVAAISALGCVSTPGRTSACEELLYIHYVAEGADPAFAHVALCKDGELSFSGFGGETQKALLESETVARLRAVIDSDALAFECAETYSEIPEQRSVLIVTRRCRSHIPYDEMGESVKALLSAVQDAIWGTLKSAWPAIEWPGDPYWSRRHLLRVGADLCERRDGSAVLEVLTTGEMSLGIHYGFLDDEELLADLTTEELSELEQSLALCVLGEDEMTMGPGDDRCPNEVWIRTKDGLVSLRCATERVDAIRLLEKVQTMIIRHFGGDTGVRLRCDVTGQGD